MKFRLLLIFVLVCVNVSLIPNQCALNATNNKICCPVHSLYGSPCGYPIKGSCERIIFGTESVPTVSQIDDRAYWPRRFFSHLCSCKDNYFGVSCEECRPGFVGRDCNRKRVLVRKNILSLSPIERRIFNDIIRQGLQTPSNYVVPTEMKNELSDPIVNPTWIDTSIQYKKVFDHRFASRSTLFKSEKDCQNYGKLLDFNHNAVGFLTWHRYMMIDWERQLQKIAAKKFGIMDFRLPYWDWTDLTSCNICTDDLIGSEGELESDGLRISDESPYYNWTEFCTEPSISTDCYGCHKSRKTGILTRRWNNFNFPSLEDIMFTLEQKKYFSKKGYFCDSFHKAIEGNCGSIYPPTNTLYMHNKIHQMIDGSMCCTSTSVNDPLFILHHTQIDRIFQAWWQIHKPKLTDYPVKGELPGHGRHSHLVGFIPLITHGELFSNTTDLGYVYDNYDFSINRNVVDF